MSNRPAIKKEFTLTHKIYQARNYPKIGESLMCTIHQFFEEKSRTNKHNCIGCNLEDSSKLISNTLSVLKNYDSTFNSFVIFTMTLYLMVERINELFQITNIPLSYRQRHFKIFDQVKKWANFFKHPKAFMFVHHPDFIYIKDFKKSDYSKAQTTFVDDNFINTYYSGDQKNNELYRQLTNKADVVVILPNPSDLITAFCDAQEKLVNLIERNEVYREVLSEKSTLSDYFMDEDELM